MASDVKVTWPQRHDVFGVQITRTTYDEVVEKVIAAARRRQPATLAFTDVNGLMCASGDAKYREVYNGLDVVASDGQPVRWALNYFHRAGLTERVYGPETTARVCQAAAEAGISVYLYGGHPDVLETLKTQLAAKYPKLVIAGAESPPFRALTAEEDAAAVRRINDSGAGILLLGLGAPKQETFAYEHRDSIKAVQMCVGAAFDLHAGVRKMAPGWMQRNGLECLYRLYQEPGRLWKRYLLRNTRYLFLFAIEAIRRGRAKPAAIERIVEAAPATSTARAA